MRVAAARAVSALTQRVLFFTGLFLGVIVLHLGVVAGLRAAGFGGGLALLVSGVLVLAVVLGATRLLNALIARDEAKADGARAALGLPEGPCCAVLRADGDDDARAFPWEIEGVVRAQYPKLARRFGIEGYALVHFEVGADGAAKNIHCLDAWPTRIFYDSAVEALQAARFRPRADANPRFGAGYRMPFVFRIEGYARTGERGRRARRRRPLIARLARLLGR